MKKYENEEEETITTIQMRKGTVKKFVDFKIFKRETYDEMIIRLCDEIPQLRNDSNTLKELMDNPKIKEILKEINKKEGSKEEDE